MELPNRKIDGKYNFADDGSNIIREATEEEARALETSLIVEAREAAMSPLTESEVSRMLITQQINTLSVDDNTALRMREFYPEWAENTAYTAGFKVRHGDKLWRVLQAHTSQDGWQPDAAASLWEQITETHTGELTDPIPYEGNMVLESGKYYIQNGVIYLCNRDTVNPVYNPLAELVGIYVEIV